MISKTLKVNKKISYREIFKKIYSFEKLNFKVCELCIDDTCISYDLISEENEVSVSLLLIGDVSSVPTISDVVVSIEKGDLNLLNTIRLVWNDRLN